MELQEKKSTKRLKQTGITLERTSVNRFLLILDLKLFRSQVKGKHSMGKNYRVLLCKERNC